MTLDELDAENRVLRDQIRFQEANLKSLYLWLGQNEEEISKQLSDMKTKSRPTSDCTLCLGECQ